MNFWQLTVIIQLTRSSSSASGGSVILNFAPFGCFRDTLCATAPPSSPESPGPPGRAGFSLSPSPAAWGSRVDGFAVGSFEVGLRGAPLSAPGERGALGVAGPALAGNEKPSHATAASTATDCRVIPGVRVHP